MASSAKEPLIKSFDKLRTNGSLLIPFVVSLSNHTLETLDQGIPKVLRHRWPLLLILTAVLLAWFGLYRMDLEMRAMAEMDMPMPASSDWGTADWLSVWFAWALMMAAMMVPASWPLLKLMQHYGNRHLAPLLTGYIAMWTLYSLLATLLQWLLSQTTAFDPLAQRLTSGWSALVLALAGIYQFTPFKQSCLHRCQSPFTLLMTRWRADTLGSFRLGLYHGSFCVGCCWMLMLVLFALGAMNVYWAAALALATSAERLLPPPWPGRLLSASLLLAALLILLNGKLLA